MDDMTAMERDASDILNRLKNEGLTDAERHALREELRLFMAEHPVRIPLGIRLAAKLRTPFIASRTGYAYRAVALASVAVIFAGIGTSYAAENALPGEPLYAVKININEPLQSAFAVSTAQQANWDTQLANRRLEEAEALAAQGKLTRVTASDLQAQLSTVTQRFDQNVAELNASSTSDASAVAATDDMQATLTAHATVMSQIAEVVPQAAAPLAPLVADVQAQVLELQMPQPQQPKATAAAVHLDAAVNETASTTPVHAPQPQQFSAPMHRYMGPANKASQFEAAATSTASNTANISFGAATSSQAQVQPAVHLMSAREGFSPTPSASSSIATDTDNANVNVNAAVNARAAEIARQAREWIKNTVGVELPVPQTQIDGAYKAVHIDGNAGAGIGL